MIIKKSRARTNKNQKASNKLHCKKQAHDSRKTLDGFPVPQHSLTNLQIDEYFNAEEMVCLVCGKRYKSIGHLHLRVHGITQRMYREMYDLPITKPLDVMETRYKKRKTALSLIEAGIIDMGELRDTAKDFIHKGQQKGSVYKTRKIRDIGFSNADKHNT